MRFWILIPSSNISTSAIGGQLMPRFGYFLQRQVERLAQLAGHMLLLFFSGAIAPLLLGARKPLKIEIEVPRLL
ncbi:hypothetical protein [Bartonella sp. HY406]|uniref:hypothetical protein n=1 Tax=Bartonella sp. HY406 TaxID=2979331 RepID=UPI0021CAB225|nr:hypothetical protein [Bartonella sp. HY406]UXN02632.1 hypothetical protein N6B01_09115 [Bartonella sp. HY406]